MGVTDVVLLGPLDWAQLGIEDPGPTRARVGQLLAVGPQADPDPGASCRVVFDVCSTTPAARCPAKYLEVSVSGQRDRCGVVADGQGVDVDAPADELWLM